jgi:hypothetical protein
VGSAKALTSPRDAWPSPRSSEAKSSVASRQRLRSSVCGTSTSSRRPCSGRHA